MDVTRERRGGLALLLLVLLVVAALAVVAVPRAGRFLLAEEPVPHADVAVVLSGGAVIRALAAADLYRQHRIDRILVIPDPPEPGRDRLVQLGLVDPKQPPWPQRILTASGVPADRIASLPYPIDGTINEARAVREFFGDHPPKTLVIVTSEFASRRARWIFRRVFRDQPVTVLSEPSHYDMFQTDRWWAQPRNALMVLTEYEKFASNALTLALQR